MPDLQFFVSLGIGGVLAWGMFLLYRRDMTTRLEEWKGQSASTLEALQNNTRVITLLNERLERMERIADRADGGRDRRPPASP